MLQVCFWSPFEWPPQWIVIRGCCLSLPTWTKGSLCLPDSASYNAKDACDLLLDSSTQLLCNKTAVQLGCRVCVMDNVARWAMCFWLFRRGHLPRRTFWGCISPTAIIRSCNNNCNNKRLLWCVKCIKAIVLQSKSKLPERCCRFASCIMK